MKKKRIIAMLLAGCMMFALCACGSQTISNPQQLEQTKGEVAEDGIALVNGRRITKEDFSYFIGYYMNYVQESYGEVEDWTAEIAEGKTYGDYVKEAALDWFVYAAAMIQQAERSNITLNEEDKTYLANQWEEFVSGYDDEASALAALEEYSCTKELYQYILEVQYLGEKIFNNLYGENGQALSDEQCAAMVEGDGYLMAKHILLQTQTQNENGETVDMSEEEKAEKHAKLEKIKEQLEAAEPDERAKLFDELMLEYSEDPGSTNSPEGYLFQEGNMVTEFYEGTLALEEYEISEIVVTSYGYHLIERIPINYDVVPSSYYGYDYLTLRYLCADEAYNSSINSWMERVETEKLPSYESVTIEDLTAKG